MSDVLDNLYNDVVSRVNLMTEEDATFFSSAVVPTQASKDDWSKVTGGTVEKVHALGSYLTTEVVGNVKAEHGWVGDDYVWHFTPNTRSGGWAVSVDRVITAIVHTMNLVIPQTVMVDIFKPMLDWEIKLITFKAKNLREVWNITKEDLESLLESIFGVLHGLK